MIKFFRKIRQNMIKENKVSKYLLYAIGEIVLVVIGILIALQINNWNDQQKINKQEIKLLKELIDNMDANIETLENMNQLQSQQIQGIDSIMYHFKNATSSDSLRQFFLNTVYTETLNLSYSTFETIKTIGFDILKDDQIRLAIMELFEVSYSRHLKTITDVVSPIFFQNVSEWILNNRQNMDRIFESTAFRNDDNYNFIKNYIESKRAWKSSIIKNNIKLIQETNNVKSLIKVYLIDRANN